MKKFLFELRADAKRLFSYPKVNLGMHPVLDYDLYWESRKGNKHTTVLSHWQKQRADLMLPILSKGDVVIDFGGGSGEILRYFEEQKGVSGICVDFNQSMLDIASSYGIKVIKADISKMEELSKLPDCDYLFGFEILEHVPNPEEIVKFLETKVRKGLVFSFPNSGFYVYRLRMLFGKFPVQWFTHPSEHLRFWTVSDAQWWARSLGFAKSYIKTYEGLPFLNKVFPKIFAAGQVVFLPK